MNTEDQFHTEKLIHNTIAAFKNGYIQEDAALSTIDFAAKLGDKNAQTILEQCKQTSFAQAIESFGKQPPNTCEFEKQSLLLKRVINTYVSLLILAPICNERTSRV